jgi:BirA family transcriptional regulator, biotin operon repressor / biotin---[acetyl-CoA-carboxylase] ligase
MNPACVFKMIKQHDFSGHRLILTSEVESTNNYASNLLASEKVEEGTIILTFRQTKGRGHGKNVWESEDFKNLTFSLILFPRFLPASRQFLLSQVVSLGLFDFLSSETSEITIKWPNDLLINDKKTAGILIENSVSGPNLFSSIIGIGININQISFPTQLPQATSLAISTGKEYPLEETLQIIVGEIMKWYFLLKDNQTDIIEKTYLKHLFRLGEKSIFRKENQVFKAQIIGIDKYGQLLLLNAAGEKTTCPFKSIEMLFP